jgi:hypothetical protein
VFDDRVAVGVAGECKAHPVRMVREITYSTLNPHAQNHTGPQEIFSWEALAYHEHAYRERQIRAAIWPRCKQHTYAATPAPSSIQVSGIGLLAFHPWLWCHADHLV